MVDGERLIAPGRLWRELVRIGPCLAFPALFGLLALTMAGIRLFDGGVTPNYDSSGHGVRSGHSLASCCRPIGITTVLYDGSTLGAAIRLADHS